MSQIIGQPTAIRTFEIVQYVTGPLEGEFKDWPSNIQDRIMDALDRKSKEVELPLTIVHSYCDIDHGEAMDRSQDRYFLRIIASEIVVGDARMVRDAQAELKEVISDIIAGRRVH